VFLRREALHSARHWPNSKMLDKIGRKGLLKTSDLAYLASLSMTIQKCFITWTISDNLIKLFFFVTDAAGKESGVFVLSKNCQPSLIFAD
jgi:hypothetical protein